MHIFVKVAVSLLMEGGSVEKKEVIFSYNGYEHEECYALAIRDGVNKFFDTDSPDFNDFQDDTGIVAVLGVKVLEVSEEGTDDFAPVGGGYAN